MAELKANTRRRPWWSGRVEVRELLELEAGSPAARPSWPRPPIVRGVLGGPAQRRRQPLPTPPRRDRPIDLEATAEGVQLYGPRRAVATWYQLAAPASRTPADTLGTKLTYRPLEGRPARVTSIRVNRTAAAAGLVVAVSIYRGGVQLLLWELTNADLVTATPFVVLPGDEFRVEVTAAGPAGVELITALSIEEWT